MDNFLGEVRIFGCNFAPYGWATCSGQLMAIAQNTALFSLLGTQYGGDGRVTFGLPNLQGQAAIGQGQGPGLSLYVIGQQGGSELVTLNSSQSGPHTHNVNCSTNDGTNPAPNDSVLSLSGADSRANVAYVTGTTGPFVNMGATQLGLIGGNQPHNNVSPYLTLNYCIALQGVFPSRP